MFKKIKETANKAHGWLTKPRLFAEEKSIAEAMGEAFMEGSGLAIWSVFIPIGLYCLITGQKLTFTKR